MRREGALSRSDFNDLSKDIDACRVSNAFEDGLSNQEMLPEAAAH